MKIHEYQAKDIFGKSGIPVPNGQVVASSDEATKVCQIINGPPWVVKAQVHAGGRGKGGGVKVAHYPNEVVAAAEALLGKALVTPQTEPGGVKVHQVLIEEGVDIDREFYLGMVIDRAKATRNDFQPGRRHGHRRSCVTNPGAHLDGICRTYSRLDAASGKKFSLQIRSASFPGGNKTAYGSYGQHL